jgi:nicotinamidase-related amidase/RimJ/RimL family protein N-acetyltransferase
MRHYRAAFNGQHVNDWIERNMNRYRKDGFGLWAVCLKETGELIGDCGLTLQNIHGEILPEIGYHIRRDCQRKGYTGEAAKAVCSWAFRNTDYRALYSCCKYTNVPSVKTAESIGMHFVCEYPDEANGTTHVSAISREEWLNEITEKSDEQEQRSDKMNGKALVVIDSQNDITKHYRNIIENINSAVDWAMKQGMTVIYIKHNNLSAGTRTFKPGTKGAELVPELRIVSDHIFVKTKANALTSEAFSEFIRSKEIREFFIAGADATACVKSTCFNMAKAGYAVHVISDCVTSYDLKKLPEMLAYYADKGCEVRSLEAYRNDV